MCCRNRSEGCPSARIRNVLGFDRDAFSVPRFVLREVSDLRAPQLGFGFVASEWETRLKNVMAHERSVTHPLRKEECQKRERENVNVGSWKRLKGVCSSWPGRVAAFRFFFLPVVSYNSYVLFFVCLFREFINKAAGHNNSQCCPDTFTVASDLGDLRKRSGLALK